MQPLIGRPTMAERMSRVIEGFEIGHHTADRDGWLTGTTVVLVARWRGGWRRRSRWRPGTRETDLLGPTHMVEPVHAVVLTGGSAYGLAAANGVMEGLEAAHIGWPVGPEPSSGGSNRSCGGHLRSWSRWRFGNRPTRVRTPALAAASSAEPATGLRGGGTGAVCGGIKAGFGYAEMELDSGVSVAAAVVVNAAGSAVDPASGGLSG